MEIRSGGRRACWRQRGWMPALQARSRERSRGDETEAPTPVTVGTPCARRDRSRRDRRRGSLSGQSGQRDAQDQRAGEAHAGQSRRSREGRASCSPNWKAGDLAAAANESQSHHIEQAQAAYQTVTGATVLEDKTKAQADVQSAQQSAATPRRSSTTTASRCRKKGRWRRSWWTDAKVAMVAGAEPVRNRAAAPEDAEQVGRARGDSRRAGADERGQGALRERRGAAFLRADPQPDQRRGCGPRRLSGRDGRQRHAHRFDRRYLAGGGARQCSGERSAVHSRSAGPRASPGPRAISPGKVTVVSPGGRSQHDHGRSVGAGRQSRREAEARRHRARRDHRRDDSEHAGGSRVGAAQFRRGRRRR